MEYAAYSNAWNIYLLCAACILLAQLSLLWIFSKRWVFFIMAVTAVVMLLPYESSDNANWKTPAVAVFFIDHFLLKGTQWPDAMYSIIKAVAFTVLGFVLFLVALMYKDHYFPKAQSDDEDRDAERDYNNTFDQDDEPSLKQYSSDQQDAYTEHKTEITHTKKPGSTSKKRSGKHKNRKQEDQKYRAIDGAYATDYLDADDSFSALDDGSISLTHYSNESKDSSTKKSQQKNKSLQAQVVNIASAGHDLESNDEDYNAYYSNSNYYHSFSPRTTIPAKKNAEEGNSEQQNDALKNYYVASTYYVSAEKSIENVRQKPSVKRNSKSNSNTSEKNSGDDNLLVIPLDD